MEEKEFYKILGYIKISPTRQKTLLDIDDEIRMPSEIARSTKAKTSQVSGALTDMKKYGLVVCINEEARKGRLYKTTDAGKEVIKFLKKNRRDE